MKQFFKVVIFCLGLVALVGLGLCASMIMTDSVKDMQQKNKSNQHINALAQRIEAKKASAYEQWLYARLLQSEWANDALTPKLSAQARSEKATQYLQKAIDNDITEAMLDKGITLIQRDADNKTGEGSQGIDLIIKAYSKGCDVRYEEHFSRYNWYQQDINPIWTAQRHYKTVKSYGNRFLKARDSKSHAIRQGYALISMYHAVHCDTLKNTQTQLIARLVDGGQPVLYKATDYVIATRIKEHEIADIIKRKIKPKHKAAFDKNVAWLNHEYNKRFATYPTRAIMKRAEEHVQSTRLDNTHLRSN